MRSNSALVFGGGQTPRRLIVHATNIHTGGGAKLLDAILRARPARGELVLFCDSRMPLDKSIEAAIEVFRFEPEPFARLAAERKLQKIATSHDLVLAFGNLPPLYRLKAQTVLFLQNRYLVDPSMLLHDFSRSARMRLSIERIWLKSRLSNVDRVVVQTRTMSALFEKAFGRCAEVVGLNPAPEKTANSARNSLSDETRYEFVYVSSGEPHKNHRTLIEAWVHLAQGGARPSLALTLAAENNADVIALLAEMNAAYGTKIINLGHIPQDGVDTVYDQSDALIFPSIGESYGLPLLEAAERMLPIIASEMDYVRDLVDPVQTFDPGSARSIARAVRRFLHIPPDRDESVGPAEFLHRIYTESR